MSEYQRRTFQWKCPECKYVKDLPWANREEAKDWVVICPDHPHRHLVRDFSACFIYSGPTGVGKKRPKRKT